MDADTLIILAVGAALAAVFAVPYLRHHRSKERRVAEAELRGDPESPNALLLLGACHRWEGKLEAALATCGGNQTEAARMLGISRRTLINKIEQYDLPRPRKG